MCEVTIVAMHLTPLDAQVSAMLKWSTLNTTQGGEEMPDARQTVADAHQHLGGKLGGFCSFNMAQSRRRQVQQDFCHVAPQRR